MLSRPKKSKAGSIVSSSVRKLIKGLSKEEQISKKILEHFREHSLRVARDIEPALYAKEFRFYERARRLYAAELQTLETQRAHYLSSKSKRRKQEKLQKNSGQKFRLLVKVTIDTIKLVVPYYYESDLYRFLSLAKLNTEEAMRKLNYLLNTPFSYSISFFIKLLTGRSLPQLSVENFASFVEPLFVLSFKEGLEVSLRAAAIDAVSALLQSEEVRQLVKGQVAGFLTTNQDALLELHAEVSESYGRLLVTLALNPGTIKEDQLVALILGFREAYKNAERKKVNAVISEGMRMLIMQWDQDHKEKSVVENMVDIFVEMCKDEDVEVRKAGIRGFVTIGNTRLGRKKSKTLILDIIEEINKKAIEPVLSEDLGWLCYLINGLYSDSLEVLFDKQYYDCLFRLSTTANNTRYVIQSILGDLSARWQEKLAEKDALPSTIDDMSCQHGVRELEEIMKTKKVDEIFQILGELSTSQFPQSVENAFWFLEHYVLTHVPRATLKRYYSLLSKLAIAFSDFAISLVVQTACVKVWLLIISDGAWEFLPLVVCSALNWISKGFAGIPDALRVLSFLILDESARKSIEHFPHTKAHISSCIEKQSKSLADSYKDTIPKRTYFAGLLRLIKLCRQQRENAVDEIKAFYSDRMALRNESSIYYAASLRVLIAVYDSLSEKDQDQQIRLMCGLCQSSIFKRFTNTRTISWLLDCACHKKNKYGDKAAKSLSILVNECDPSESIFDTAMDKLVGLFAALDKSSIAYKALASSYILILEPRLWHIVNNVDIINNMAEWLELGAVSDSALEKYLNIVIELARWEDGQKALARPGYIRALCKLLAKDNHKYKHQVYRIARNISKYREFEGTEAIHTLREEMCAYIGGDTHELQHKEVVEALANTMASPEAAEDAWNRGFISAILSFQATGQDQMLDIIKLLNRSISSKKVCGMVIKRHGDGVIGLYKHVYMKILAINAIEIISQNLAFLFYDPKFLLKLLSSVSLFKEWSDYIEIGTDKEIEEREFTISKMSKSLIFLAADPDCHLLIMEHFMQKYLDLVSKASDIHLQHELLQFVNDLLIINPIPYSHRLIGSYMKQIKALGSTDKPKLATLALWCFSLFFDINYSKEYAEFYDTAGILSYIAETTTHPDLQLAEDALKAMTFILKDKELKRKYSERYMMLQIDHLLRKVDSCKLSTLVFVRYIAVLSKANQIFITKLFEGYEQFTGKVFKYICDACVEKEGEDKEKIIEEGLRMITFVSDDTSTHKRILESGILQRVYDSVKPDAFTLFQLCSTVILNIGLNQMNYLKLTEENVARIVRGLAKKENYFVQMDIMTVIKILLTCNNEKIRSAASKVYLDTVIATTAASKFTNVIAICGFILQYY